MVDWEYRDKVLKAVYDLSEQSPGAHEIRDHLGDSLGTVEEITEALTWLADQGLLKDLGRSWGGGVLRAEASPLGKNYVETGTSVEELAKASVERSIVNAQTNYNQAPSINNMGDNVTITQNNQEQIAEELIAEFRKANDTDRADQLEAEKKHHGAASVLATVRKWIADRVLSSEVIAAVAPIALSAGV